jgi:hypothetical protein
VSKIRVGILVLFLIFNSCAAPQSCTAQRYKADFYEGLKKRQNGAQSEAVSHFEKALSSPNTYMVSAAAAELMSLHSAGTKLSAATMADIRQKAVGSWAKVFEIQEQEQSDKEKLLAFLLEGDSRSLGEAEYYTLEKLRGNSPLTEAENAAIDGRIAASRFRYNEALLFFRIALGDSSGLFFQYPDLLVDMGRTFQYTASGREGINLLLDWEENGAIPAENENLIRFRLLFFAARMARQRGDSKNIEMFEKALPFAREVSPEQSDACIWYILDSSLSQNSGRMIRHLETYIPQWHDASYFYDVMGKLARELVYRRQWENAVKVFTLLRNRPCVATAQYAWISGRIVDEGLFSPEESSPVYMRAAYDSAGASAVVEAWYYRSLSAAALGEPFLPLFEEPPAPESRQKRHRQEMRKKNQQKPCPMSCGSSLVFLKTTPRNLHSGTSGRRKIPFPPKNCISLPKPLARRGNIRNPSGLSLCTQNEMIITLPGRIWNCCTLVRSRNWLNNTPRRPALNLICCTALSGRRAPLTIQ